MLLLKSVGAVVAEICRFFDFAEIWSSGGQHFIREFDFSCNAILWLPGFKNAFT